MSLDPRNQSPVLRIGTLELNWNQLKSIPNPDIFILTRILNIEIRLRVDSPMCSPNKELSPTSD